MIKDEQFTALDAFGLRVTSDFAASVGVSLMIMANGCGDGKPNPLRTPDGASAVLTALSLLTMDLAQRIKARESAGLAGGKPN